MSRDLCFSVLGKVPRYHQDFPGSRQCDYNGSFSVFKMWNLFAQPFFTSYSGDAPLLHMVFACH